MNLGQLIAEARSQLDDPESPGAGDDSDSLWTNAELKSYANRAVEEACIRAGLIVDSETASVCQISVVDATALYAISDRILSIQQMKLSGVSRVLTQTGYKYLNDKYSDWEVKTGEPSHYILDAHNRKLLFFRIPEQAYTATMTVNRLPLTDMVADGDLPEIPVQFHFDLLYWIKSLAYQKHDAETRQPALSKDADNDFTNIFGARPNANWAQHKRNGYSRRTKAQFV